MLPLDAHDLILAHNAEAIFAAPELLADALPIRLPIGGQIGHPHAIRALAVTLASEMVERLLHVLR